MVGKPDFAPSQKAFLDRVNELGISFNGTTSDERVNYFFTLSKDKLGEGIDFMNSAIRYPLFDTAEMRRENPVVAGEFQRAESNPFFTLMDKSNREVWQDNYSRKNPIGDYKIIYSATAEKMNVIKNKYEDIISYNVDDFEILDYEFHPVIKMEMIA